MKQRTNKQLNHCARKVKTPPEDLSPMIDLLNAIMELPGAQGANDGEVKRLWTSGTFDGGEDPGPVNPLVVLDRKLRALASGLRSWGERSVGNIKLQLVMAHELILRFDTAQESRRLSPHGAKARSQGGE